MSAFDDGGMNNVLSPLKHSLIRQIPNPPQIMPGMDNPAMRMQTAHSMGRPQGQTATPQNGPGQRGPMAGALYKTLMLKESGVGPDESDYHQLAHDPSTTPQMLHQLLQMRQPRTPQPEQANHGASIGGAAAAGTAPGSIQVTRGHGPNAMSEEAMSQWAHRVAAQPGEGEQFSRVQNEEVPRKSFFQKPTGFGAKPGDQYAGRGDITRGPLQGFQVNGIKPPVEPQQATPPMTIEQAKLQHQQQHDSAMLEHQKTVEAHANIREQSSQKHAEFAENKTVLDGIEKQMKQFSASHPEVEGGEIKDPGVMKEWQSLNTMASNVRERMQSAVTPTQNQGQPPMVKDAASHAAIPSGTTYMSPDGKLRRKQ